MKRSLTLLLAVLMALSLLAACANDGEPVATDATETANDVTTEAESTAFTAEIPSDFDFGGYNFRIYAYSGPRLRAVLA